METQKYVCHICYKITSKRHLLNDHLWVIHKVASRKPYLCPVAECCEMKSTSNELRSHLYLEHNQELEEQEQIMVNKNHVCHICRKVYLSITALYRHLRIAHQVITRKTCNPCPEKDCSVTKSTVTELRNHLNADHNYGVHEEEITFKSVEEFAIWKQEFEKLNDVYFKKCRGDVKIKALTRMYYVCNRSGSYTSKGTGKRHIKDSAKIGLFCPAYLNATISKANGMVHATVMNKHIGHDKDLKFLRLPESIRIHIATQLKNGVCPDKILNDIRNRNDNSFKRCHLLRKKDINNIKHSFGLGDIEQQSVQKFQSETNASVFQKHKQNIQDSIDFCSKESHSNIDEENSDASVIINDSNGESQFNIEIECSDSAEQICSDNEKSQFKIEEEYSDSTVQIDGVCSINDDAVEIEFDYKSCAAFETNPVVTDDHLSEETVNKELCITESQNRSKDLLNALSDLVNQSTSVDHLEQLNRNLYELCEFMEIETYVLGK